MKITVVAPLWLPIPAVAYGGVERIVENMVNGLVDKGHHVTLFAAGGTKTKAQKLVATHPKSLREDDIPWTDTNYDLIQASLAVKQAEIDQSDAIIFNVSHPHYLPVMALSKVPALFVLHGVWTTKDYAQQKRHDGSETDVLYAFKDQNFISISQAQQQMVPGLHYVANVYNGIDTNEFPFQAQGEGYAAWMGRFEEQKGPHIAIQIALKLGLKLKLAGPIRTELPKEKKFYQEQIEPYLGDQIEWVGELAMPEKARFLAGADVLINPYVYNEAFGLVTAEAQACGVPVVVPTWGGGPEIINSGVTGFMGSNLKDWIEATPKAMQLDRAACRRQAEKFSIQKMVAGYEAAILKIAKPRHQIMKGFSYQPVMPHLPASFRFQASKGGEVRKSISDESIDLSE